MYLLLIFSGLAEWQLPTEDDENVAFIAWFGSTQRVISRSINFCLTFEWVTISSVRTNRHIPFRKVGPLKPSSAETADGNKGAETISAAITRRTRTAAFCLAKSLLEPIVQFPHDGVPVSRSRPMNAALLDTLSFQAPCIKARLTNQARLEMAAGL